MTSIDFARNLNGIVGVRRERSRSDPHGGEAPNKGSRSDPKFAGACRPFVSFLHESCPERWRIWTKIGRNNLWAKLDKLTRPLFWSATRGPSYSSLKMKIWAFSAFLGDFDAIKGSKGTPDVPRGVWKLSGQCLGCVLKKPAHHRCTRPAHWLIL